MVKMKVLFLPMALLVAALVAASTGSVMVNLVRFLCKMVVSFLGLPGICNSKDGVGRFPLQVEVFYSSSECFRAAAYEHVRLKEQEENLAVFEKVTAAAAEQGADIIVFPEAALNDRTWSPEEDSEDSREISRKAAEFIPKLDSQAKVNPCQDAAKYADRQVLLRYSCMAKKNSLYVVAQMSDVQNCSSPSDKECPSDGFYLYNTAVAFDPDGTLVSVHHKHYLFGEQTYNPAPVEYSYFDTPFGRIGMFICFELGWKQPGYDLVHKYNVTTTAFPTHWLDNPPTGFAHQDQESWAITNRVNVIASNVKHMSGGSTGSGIFQGTQGAVVYEHTVLPAYSKLLIANLPVDSRSGQTCDPDIFTMSFTHREDTSEYTLFDPMPIERYVNVKLAKLSDKVKKCENGVCCTVDYAVKGSDLTAIKNYYMIVGNNIRPGPFPWCQEYCMVVAYDTAADKYSMKESAVFEHLELVSNFSTEYIYSMVLTNDFNLVPKVDWTAATASGSGYSMAVSTEEVVVVAGMYARCFEPDPSDAKTRDMSDHMSDVFERFIRG